MLHAFCEPAKLHGAGFFFLGTLEMAVKSLQAIKTEYKGVVYDSKSEAMFARMMDILKIPFQKTHPIDCGGHPWDFLIWREEMNLFWNDDFGKVFNCEFGTHFPVLVEYKPCEPTETYIENLVKKTNRDWLKCTRAIVSLNFFNDPEGFYWLINPSGGFSTGYLFHYPENLFGDTKTAHSQWQILEAFEEAKRYRFDLKHQE